MSKENLTPNKPFRLHEDLNPLLDGLGFMREGDLEERYFYTPDKIQYVVQNGSYQDQPATIRIWLRHEWPDEAHDLQAFNNTNQSQLLKGPVVLNHGQINAEVTWTIIERIDGIRQDGLPEVPFLTAKQKELWADLYLEFIKNRPQPSREKELIEVGDATHFTEARLWKWYNICSSARPLPEEKLGELSEYLKKTLTVVRREFQNIDLIWEQGHFCPSQMVEKNGIYYLRDWAHVGYRPQGYDLSFILWNLSFAYCRSGDPDPERWLKEVEDWKNVLREKLAKPMGLTNEKFDRNYDLNMLERSFGNLVTHATAETTRDPEERKRVYQLNKALVDHYLARFQ